MSSLKDPETRALEILEDLVRTACTQAGPDELDRDVDHSELVAVCRRAETLLYEVGWLRA